MHPPLSLKTDYLNLLLDLAAQQTRVHGDLAYERQLGVSLRDIRLMRLIGGKPGVVMGELSEESGIEKTLASKLVSSLVQRGLVVRHIGQKDARQTHLELSQEGVDLVKRAEPLGALLESGFELCLSPNEIQALRATLKKIIASQRNSHVAYESWLEQIAPPPD